MLWRHDSVINLTIIVDKVVTDGTVTVIKTQPLSWLRFLLVQRPLSDRLWLYGIYGVLGAAFMVVSWELVGSNGSIGSIVLLRKKLGSDDTEDPTN